MTHDRWGMTMDQVIAAALAEDVGTGDVTTQFFVSDRESARGRIFTKEPGVVAGTAVATAVFRAVDPRVEVKVLKPDGALLVKGDTILEMAGPTRALLTAERTALNFLQRLSGIATLTRRYVEAVAGTRAAILDTRKTTPLLRALEKQAVAAGGGTNHRHGLYDAVMVKDNHLLAESRPDALQRGIDAARAAHPGIRIELEVDTLDQFRAFLKLKGVDWILLDNMPRAHLREAVALVRALPPERRLKLEASGGVTIETVRPIAETGVDYVSVGALTHSSKALDLSLELTRELPAG
jgi:nicotinate-nucleotide pyrophosphorylase (carboxylating)